MAFVASMHSNTPLHLTITSNNLNVSISLPSVDVEAPDITIAISFVFLNVDSGKIPSLFRRCGLLCAMSSAQDGYEGLASPRHNVPLNIIVGLNYDCVVFREATARVPLKIEPRYVRGTNAEGRCDLRE